MKRVIIESPYAGDIERNLTYLRAAMRDCILRGEAPFASHGLYTQPGVLRDELPNERSLGIHAGHQWIYVADLVAVYKDLGISSGMQHGIAIAQQAGRPIEYRNLTGWTASV